MHSHGVRYCTDDAAQDASLLDKVQARNVVKESRQAWRASSRTNSWTADTRTLDAGPPELTPPQTRASPEHVAPVPAGSVLAGLDTGWLRARALSLSISLCGWSALALLQRVHSTPTPIRRSAASSGVVIDGGVAAAMCQR